MPTICHWSRSSENTKVNSMIFALELAEDRLIMTVYPKYVLFRVLQLMCKLSVYVLTF